MRGTDDGVVRCAGRMSAWAEDRAELDRTGIKMTRDVYALLRRWQVASAALIEAEGRDPYSYEVDDLTDEVNAARLALSQAGVRDIEALARGRLEVAHASVIGF
jgi:hypothetical protein